MSSSDEDRYSPPVGRYQGGKEDEYDNAPYYERRSNPRNRGEGRPHWLSHQHSPSAEDAEVKQRVMALLGRDPGARQLSTSATPDQQSCAASEHSTQDSIELPPPNSAAWPTVIPLSDANSSGSGSGSGSESEQGGSSDEDDGNLGSDHQHGHLVNPRPLSSGEQPPVDALCHAIIGGTVSDVEAALKSLPRAADGIREVQVERHGDTGGALTPLHAAIQSGASAAVVELLLTALPGAGAALAGQSVRGALSGVTPLHLAAYLRSDLEIVELLLRSNPDAVVLQAPGDKCFNTSSGPDRGKECQHGGETPLHVAAAVQPSVQVVTAMLRCRPEAASIASCCGVPLHLACGQQGDALGNVLGRRCEASLPASLEVIQALLEWFPAGCRTRDMCQRLPLHLAVYHGASTGAIKALIGIHPEGAQSADTFGRLPIHYAAHRMAHHDVVELLLAVYPGGAEVADGKGLLPLDCALSNCRDSPPDAGTVASLLARFPGAANHMTCDAWSGGRQYPIHRALEARDDPVVVVNLLERRAGGMESHDRMRETPVVLAIQHDAPLEVLDLLLDAFPGDVKGPPDTYGRLPLHVAASEGKFEMVRRLLQPFPAAAAVPDNDKRLPLHILLKMQAEPDLVLDVLRHNPAAAAACDGDGWLPLHWAAAREASVAVVEAILQEHPGAAAVEGTSRSGGLLPLGVAIKHNADPGVVRVLVRHHPDATKMRKSKDHELPLHMALRKRCPPATIAILLDANPTSAGVWSGQNGRLPLHGALRFQHGDEVVLSLLRRHPEAVNSHCRGDTAIGLAMQYGASMDVFQALLKAAGTHVDVRECLRNVSDPAHMSALVQTDPDALLYAADDRETNLEFLITRGAVKLEVFQAAMDTFPPESAADNTRHGLLQGTDTYDNSFDLLPLHCAVSKGSECTLDKLLILLERFPSEAAAWDENDCLPLHLAAACGWGVVRSLPGFQLASISSAGGDGVSAGIHAKAISALLASYPGAARERGGEGRLLPLALAVRAHAPTAVVQELLQAYPDAAQVPAGGGRLPLHWTCTAPDAADTVELLLQAFPEAAMVRDAGLALPVQLASGRARQVLVQAGEQLTAKFLAGAQCAAQFCLHKQPEYAAILAKHASAHPECLQWRCSDGERLFDGAHPDVRLAVREAVCFLGRFLLLEGVPAHRSATCTVVFATDTQARAGKPEGVALKLMQTEENFLAELETRKSRNLSEEYVLDVQSAYRTRGSGAERSGSDGGEQTAVNVQLVDSLALPWEDDYSPRHGFCLVMERASRSLRGVIDNEQVAGHRWHDIRQITADLLEALHHLHERGVVHGDVKPRNVVWLRGRWRLIDLDVSCRIGDAAFCRKAPSTAFCAPEVARFLAGQASTAQSPYQAAVAADLWSFGVVLYNLASGMTLWHADQDDNLKQSGSSFQLLAAWSDSLCRSKLEDVDLEPGSPARLLLEKLLCGDPAARLASFPAGAADVRRDPFFEEMRRPLSTFIDEQLGPVRRATNRVVEAWDFIRSQAPVRGSPEGGFLKTWARATTLRSAASGGPPPSLRDKVPDDKQLSAFADMLHHELSALKATSKHLRDAAARVHDAEARLAKVPVDKVREHGLHLSRKLQAERDELEAIHSSEIARLLRYLDHLRHLSYLCRNYSSHFNAEEGGSLAQILQRRHVRFMLDSWMRFFLCLQHLALDRPAVAGCSAETARDRAKVLGTWAQRCANLLGDQCEDDDRNPVEGEPLISGPCSVEELRRLALDFLPAFRQTAQPLAKRLPRTLGDPATWTLLEPDGRDQLAWLADLAVRLRFVADVSSSRTFSDPAWGCALAEELLEISKGRLPSCLAHPTLVRFRTAELRSRLARYFAGTRARSEPQREAHRSLRSHLQEMAQEAVARS